MRFLLVLFTLFGASNAFAWYPCIQSGVATFTTCFPASGLLLTNQQVTRYSELAVNGTNFVELKAPAALVGNTVYTLPPVDGSSGDVLQTDGGGAMSWVPASSGTAIGGAITGGTDGSVLFISPSNVLAQDNANFYWDNTNNFLGIGLNTPAVPLHVLSNAGDGQIAVDGDSGVSAPAAIDYYDAGISSWRVGRGAFNGSTDFQFYDYHNTPGVRMSIIAATGAVSMGTVGQTLVKASGVVRFVNMDTATRDALIGSEPGDTIYNTDTNAMEYFDGTAWN